MKTYAGVGSRRTLERGARAAGGRWPGFSGYKNGRLEHPSAEAVRVAASLHPVRKLIARNGHQVLGAGMDDPVVMVVCWTPDGAETGGTGQAIRPASRLGVPVVNLKRPGALEG